MQGNSCAVVSYSTIGQDPAENSYFQRISSLIEAEVLFPQELPGGVGVCLISNIDNPNRNLVKGAVFQTFLFESKASEAFRSNGINLVIRESSGRGIEGFTRHIGLLKNL